MTSPSETEKSAPKHDGSALSVSIENEGKEPDSSAEDALDAALRDSFPASDPVATSWVK